MDNIFIPNVNKQSSNIRQSELFTLIGQHNFLDADKNPRINSENNKVYAKKVLLDNNQKYYIKVGTHGKIYNPIGLFSEGTANKFLSKIGKKAWEFKEVNSKVFDMYVNFLRTKNIAWLNNAEREMT